MYIYYIQQKPCACVHECTKNELLKTHNLLVYKF